MRRLLLVAVILAACRAQRQAAETVDSAASRVDSLQLLLADKRCSGTADCVLVPLGEKICGGPRSYDVASVHADTATIRRLAEQLRATEERRNATAGLAGECSVTPPPVVRCTNGACSTN